MATSFHGFLVKEKIGSGGMSTVYKGIHETLGYPVAIKVLHPGMAGDKSFIARFEREAKAASALRNNNIASVIDFGSEDDIYFIVMEFVEGEDLGQILNRIKEAVPEYGVFPIEIVLSLLEEVAYGLKDAHEQGIIHRDIKPTNILLHKRGEVKIADFGLARDTGDVSRLSDQDLTVPGTVVGTPSFMSPEQAAGRELDSRTDIFSLGVMVYQLLMGEKPFQGATAAEVQEAIITQDPPALTIERCPLLTEEVQNMVTRMLAKDPNRRFQNMDQLLRSLSECMESVDTTGGLIKFKRDYLTKFAQDPVGFSRELRERGINNHLKQGYHFQKMGLSNIDDAIREFSYVLSLDPENDKARTAIQELMKNAEESGIVPAYKAPGTFDAGETQVLPTSVAAPGAQGPPVPPPARGKPGKGLPVVGGLNPLVLYGGGALLLVLILAVVFWPRGSGEKKEEQPPVVAAAETAPGPSSAGDGSETPVRETESGEQETPVDLAAETTSPPVPEKPAGDTASGTTAGEAGQESEGAGTAPAAAATETAEPGEPAAVPVGRLRITSEPSGATVYMKPRGESRFHRAGTTPFTSDDLAAGSWEIRLEKDGYVGKSKVFGVRQDQERALSFTLSPVPPPVTGPGYFRLVVVPYGDVFLDGELKVKGKKLAVIPADAGRKHRLRIHHGATLGDIVIADVKVSSGDTLNLGRKIFTVGHLKIGANPQAKVLLDGVELSGFTPLDLERVLVGDHVLSASKPGFVVDKAWLFGPDGKVELKPTNPGEANLRYRIHLVKNETLKIKFDLKAAN